MGDFVLLETRCHFWLGHVLGTFPFFGEKALRIAFRSWGFYGGILERATGIEPTTSSLGRLTRWREFLLK